MNECTNQTILAKKYLSFICASTFIPVKLFFPRMF